MRVSHVLYGMIVLFLLIVVVAFMLIYNSEPYITRKINEYIKERADRIVQIDSLSAGLMGNVFAKAIFIKDDIGDTLCTIGKISSAIQPLGLLDQKLHIISLQMDNSDIRIKRSKKDTLFNYEVFVQSMIDTSVSDNEDSEWNYIISHLLLNNFSYSYLDSLDAVFVDVKIGTLECLFDELPINTLLEMDGSEFNEVIMSVVRGMSWSGKINIKAANKLNLTQIYFENIDINYKGNKALGGFSLSLNTYFEDQID